MQPFGNDVPIGDVPTCSNMVGTAVLEIQIVGVLPNIKSVDGLQALANRVSSVSFFRKDKLSVFLLCEPCPVRAKGCRCSLRELRLEVLETTERSVDGFQQTALRKIVLAWRTELREVEHMVQNLSGIVEKRPIRYLSPAKSACSHSSAGKHSR